MNRAILLALLLCGCPGPVTPPPVPPAPIPAPTPPDPVPTPVPTPTPAPTSACQAACDKAAMLGCNWAGVTCQPTCERYEAAGGALSWNPACEAAATSCDAQKACRK